MAYNKFILLMLIIRLVLRKDSEESTWKRQDAFLRHSPFHIIRFIGPAKKKRSCFICMKSVMDEENIGDATDKRCNKK